jgi:hypothetical protein
MTEDELLAAVKSIAKGLRSDLTGSLAKLDEKSTALSDSLDKMKADTKKRADNYVDDPDGTAAMQRRTV